MPPSAFLAVIDVTIESLVPGGDGLARHEGKVVFVPGVLPGERVRVGLTARKRDFDRGTPIEVLQASPDRVVPACPAAERCGGCNWLHIAPEAQARIKAETARATFRRLAGFDPGELSIETGEPFGYRNRLQVHADARGRLGFMGKGSREVVAVESCPVAHASLQPLFAEPSPWRAPARVHAFGHASRGPSELDREDRPRAAGAVHVRVLGKPMAFALTGFFQSNLALLERLIPYALDGLRGELALDLYSGSGLFAAFLREHFARVVALEEAPQAAAFIAANAPGAEVYTGKLEELLASGRFGQLGTRPDAVVVDPPREGLHADARTFLLACAAPRLVYVSCDGVTLARDLKVLLAGGYRLTDLRLFDFYPQTHHLEAVVRLEWAGS